MLMESAIEEEKISLEREIEMLKTAGNKYMESAARLKELSNDADAKFSVSVELIKDVLQNLTVDTAAIAQWLREGGDMLVRPSTYVFKTLLTEDLTDHVMLFPGRSPSGGKLI